jgi:hypothetical protein
MITEILYNRACTSPRNIPLLSAKHFYLIATIPVGIIEMNICAIWYSVRMTICHLSCHTVLKYTDINNFQINVDRVVRAIAFAFHDPETYVLSHDSTKFQITRNSKDLYFDQEFLLNHLFSTAFTKRMQHCFTEGEIDLSKSYSFRERSWKWAQRTIFTRGFSAIASLSATLETAYKSVWIITRIALAILKLHSYSDKAKVSDLTQWAIALEMSITTGWNILWNEQHYSLLSFVLGFRKPA